VGDLTPFEVQLEAELDAFELEIRRRIDEVAAAQNNPAVGPDYFRRPIRGLAHWREPAPQTRTDHHRRPMDPDGVNGAALRLLGLAPGFDKAALRRAYRLAAAHAHPDRGGSVACFQAVRNAYERLFNWVSKI